MIGLLLAVQVAAGGVVDVGIAMEARAAQSELIEPADFDPAIASGSLVLRPAVQAAVEGTTGAASAAYTPALSLVSPLSSPADPALTLLHAAQLAGDLRLGERLAVRGVLGGSYGELDPVTAQSLFRASNSARGLASTPFASLTARAGATAVLHRRLTFDVDASVDTATAFDSTSGSPPPDLGADVALDIPLTISPRGEALLVWRITRSDSLLGGAAMQAATVSGRGFFVGGGPLVGFRKQLLQQTAAELTGGVGAYYASDDQLAPVFVYIPTAQGRISTVLDLAGEAALEAGARAGANVINDPLGTLIENRAFVGVEAGVRATRTIALRGGASAATPAFTYAQRGRTSQATYTAEALVAWAPWEDVELGAGFVGTTRIFDGKPVSDLQASLSLTARTPVFHTGGRPTGSGGGTTTSIGVTRIGARSRLGTPPEREEEPLPEAELPPEPPALVPPPGVLPEAETNAPGDAPAGSQLRPLSEQEKRELRRKEKKEKQDAEKAEGAADEDADTDAPKAKKEPKD